MWRGKAGQKGGQTKTTPDTADQEGVTCTVFAACLARSMREGGQGKTGRTRPDEVFFRVFRNFRETQRGESNESRQDREAAPDGQSATLMKTRTKHDTTGTARIRIKEFVLSCRVRRVRAVSAPS